MAGLYREGQLNSWFAGVKGTLLSGLGLPAIPFNRSRLGDAGRENLVARSTLIC